jgi:hypothetical protein
VDPLGGGAVIPLAHLGHWYVSMPLYLGPVVIIFVALKVQARRERRREERGARKRSGRG